MFTCFCKQVLILIINLTCLSSLFIAYFAKMNMHNHFLSTLGFNKWTFVQRESFTHYPKQDELVLYAPTGSGKTLAYLIPLIDSLKGDTSGSLRCIIFSPTRELALQIEQVFKSLKSDVHITACYGGHPIKTEVKNLSAGPSVIVGTPGRIADHFRRGHLELNTVTHFVIDEFDKCLEIGFLKEMKEIYSQCSNLKKRIFCSATKIESFPAFVQLKKPVYIDVLSDMDEPDITFYQVTDERNRPQKMKQMIAGFASQPTIIFCNFREDVDGLSTYFEGQDYAVTLYHGGLEQDERERSLIKFRNGSAPVLICTDLGARGLDIPKIKHIIHYQLPEKEDAFIHRNGRTARMSEDGSVYLFEEDLEDARYPLPECITYKPKETAKYRSPEWTTVYFSAGKKDKINKIDLLGFICQKGEIGKQDVGMIAVLDRSSYVAIRSHLLSGLLSELRKYKIKGQKVRISVAR